MFGLRRYDLVSYCNFARWRKVNGQRGRLSEWREMNRTWQS